MGKIENLIGRLKTPWPHLDSATVTARIGALTANANLFNQSNLGLCTAAVFYHHVIQFKSSDFSTFATTLYQKGSASLGSLSVAPGLLCRNTDYAALTQQYSNTPPQADWMLMAGLRDSQNWFLPFEGAPDEAMSMKTPMEELSKWYDKTGFWNGPTSLYTYETEDAQVFLDHGGYKSDDQQVVMWINCEFLPGASQSGGSHVISLESPIVVNGSTAQFSCWSWGRDPFIQVTIDVSRLKKDFYGYIVAQTTS